VTLSETAGTALFWQYFLDVSAIFLPYLYLIFILELLHLEKKLIRYIFFTLAFLLSIFSFTPLFKKGMVFLYDFYWIDPGQYYIVFPTYFMGSHTRKTNGFPVQAKHGLAMYSSQGTNNITVPLYSYKSVIW